jgi:hypothetical protein
VCNIDVSVYGEESSSPRRRRDRSIIYHKLREPKRAQFGSPPPTFSLCVLEERKAVVVVSRIPELDAALAELQQQGLTVRLHSGQNNTWHIADGGLYSGYVVRAEELVDLRRANKLNLQAIKDLV